jgi:N-acyl homoserine lactone hydrolase
MLRRMLALAAGAMALMGMQAPTPSPPAAQRPEMALWRLDCGSAHIADLDTFSDTFAYVGRNKTLTASCYLIRHGDRYLLWDTGLPGALADNTGPTPGGYSLRVRIRDQLARIGIRPEQVTFVGISHYHGDHTGQAADFPRATLLIGTPDWEVVRARPEEAAKFGPWIEGQSRVEPVPGDHDVFGDGSVIMLNTPGHTPGHHSLLVRLPRTGAVLLTGDLYHFAENFETGRLPGFNTNRADTLASMARFREIARNLHARIIIQHEPADIAKLPAFPEPAR